jgi:hypothetical protein
MSYGRSDIAIGVVDVGSPKGGKLGWAFGDDALRGGRRRQSRQSS